ncbi:hypothetical protein PoB_007516700 [Plakobranchus ocellatus]|uniref:Uncharacterized protein n=1 Tax=Plakobranchus ocellatus TaxID=259542 RepID=A0AAV4DWG0_9GAST|nr:hypothetical protein PoB_007516700 [Plakobranchus ocellatus]
MSGSLDVCKPRVYIMVMRQSMAAADALSITIDSVYPSLGAMVLQNFMNRKITPDAESKLKMVHGNARKQRSDQWIDDDNQGNFKNCTCRGARQKRLGMQ